MIVLASAPVVVRSAFRSGGFRSALVRSSSRSGSGVVLVCSFRDFDSASRFARRWAARLKLSCAVRPLDSRWGVSVPVSGCVPFRGPVSFPVCGLRSVSVVARSVSLVLL